MGMSAPPCTSVQVGQPRRSGNRRSDSVQPCAALSAVGIPVLQGEEDVNIAALYKSRWQVELFFKWIKQHLRIRKFFGTSENAVKTQIWCAVSTYVLIAIVKKERQLDASLYTLRQILLVSVFEKTEISRAWQLDPQAREIPIDGNQMNLCDF